MKTLIALAASLFVTGAFAQAQPAPVPADGAPPAATQVPPPAPDKMPGLTGRGEAVTDEEFNHRIRLNKLARLLEVEEMEGKIAEAISRRKKAEGEAVAPAAAPLPLPMINQRGAYVPPAGGLGTTAALQPDSAIPPAIEPTPIVDTATPEIIGLIGDRALFKFDNTAVSAGPGDTVGNYTITSITGRQVNLRHNSSKDTNKSLFAP